MTGSLPNLYQNAPLIIILSLLLCSLRNVSDTMRFEIQLVAVERLRALALQTDGCSSLLISQGRGPMPR